MVESQPGIQVGDIALGDVGREGQVYTGGWELALGLGNSGKSRLLLRHRFRQELAVEVKADGTDVPALPGAEQRASAPDFQVSNGNVKTSTKLGGFKDGLEALLSGVGKLFIMVVEEVGVGEVSPRPTRPRS